VTAPASRPCASCGFQVADAALGRGAIEDPDGRRYCSPCAAKVMKGGGREAGPPGAARTPTPVPVAVPVARPVAGAKSSSRVIPAKSKSARLAGGAAPAPAAAARPAQAAKSAAKAEPAPKADRSAGPGRTSATRRVSQRISARAGLPWYTRLTRGQLIGIACGLGALLLVVIIAMAVSCGGGGRKRPGPSRVPVFGSGAAGLIAEADYLYKQQGRRDACLAKLEEARRVAGEAASKAREAAKQYRAAGQIAQAEDLEGQAAAQENLAVQANQRIYGINKSTVINAR